MRLGFIKPSWRKPAGAIAMLLIIFGWALIVLNLFEFVFGWPVLAQAVFYLIAGIAWIFPMKPIMIWTETGRFRAPR